MSSIAVDYKTFEPVILAAIRSVHNQIGGDLVEMRGYAGHLYMKAKATFQKDAGRSLKSWMWKVAWDDTYAARRIELGRQKKYEFLEDLTIICGRSERPPLSEILEGLSDEARHLVDVVLNLTEEDVKHTDDGIPKRNSLMAYLKRNLSLTQEHFQVLQEEIRTALFGG